MFCLSCNENKYIDLLSAYSKLSCNVLYCESYMVFLQCPLRIASVSLCTIIIARYYEWLSLESIQYELDNEK